MNKENAGNSRIEVIPAPWLKPGILTRDGRCGASIGCIRKIN